jgi:phage terminase large subunit-like protein
VAAGKKRASSAPSSRRAAPADPVTQYARDVAASTITAGRAVRLACDRHLRDLARQDTAAFPYRFQPARVAEMLEFFREFLTLDDTGANGQPLPFTLMRWLVFSFGSLVGWVDRTGHLRFIEAYLETGKGSTKTPAAAGFGLYRLVGWNRSSLENYSLGVNGDQANYLYGFAKRMAERSDDLRDLLDVGEYNTAWIERNSFFRPLTSEGRSLDNKRVFTALMDEVHEYPSPVIPEKMRLGVKSQVDALIIGLTNSGFDKTSVCWTKHDYGIKVLEGVVADEQFFPYICQLDACQGCRDKGATQPNDGCAACDSWTDERVWPKVNPAVLEMPSLVGYLRGVVKQATNQPSTLARVKRLNFCIWTQGHSIWIPSERWDACRAENVGQRRGVPCAAMFDMSMKVDLTACVIAQRIDDEPAAPVVQVEIEENDQGRAVKKLWSVNYTIELTTYFWLPEDTLIERVKNEGIPYNIWQKLGFLRTTPGPVIDHHLIYDQFVEEIGPAFKPQIIGYDPYNATEFAVGLRDRAKYTLAEIGQGRKLSEFVKLFDALVRLGRVRHNGNPVMGWCVSNAEPKFDRYENVWLEKSNPTKRIDGAIAAIGATSLVTVLPRPRFGPRRGARIWTPGGFRPAGDTTGGDHARA